MNIYWCKTDPKNVGDALNNWLWPRVLPEIEDIQPKTTLFGIGSILDQRVNDFGPTYVVGSGARGINHGVKNRNDLKFLAVRGPLTAAAFNLPEQYSTIDPAALLALRYKRPSTAANRIGLVPYFKSPHKPWQEIAERLDFDLISPHLEVTDFLSAISQCDFVISEAMHGAIIADALRIPWHPIRANCIEQEGDTSNFKWSDWCGSINLDFTPKDLPPLWEHENSFASQLKRSIKQKSIETSLTKIVKGKTRFLSNESILKTKCDMLLNSIEKLRKI